MGVAGWRFAHKTEDNGWATSSPPLICTAAVAACAMAIGYRSRSTTNGQRRTERASGVRARPDLAAHGHGDVDTFQARAPSDCQRLSAVGGHVR